MVFPWLDLGGRESEIEPKRGSARARVPVKERWRKRKTEWERASEHETVGRTDDRTEWRYTGREKSSSVPWTTALAYRGSLRSLSYVRTAQS